MNDRDRASSANSVLATVRGEMKDLTLNLMSSIQAQTRSLVFSMMGTVIALGGVILGVLKFG